MTGAPGEIEQRRLALQAELDAKKNQAERNRLGQFATPTALAREILTSSLALLPTSEPIRFLDPAIGTGSFYSALRATTAPKRIVAAVGFEIDAHYGKPASQLWAGSKLRIVLDDFTAAPPPTDTERFNLVICNPPYVRHHHLERREKARLQRASEEVGGIKIAGLAGLYCYFIALSHTWMKDNGVAAWLIPSEFMDVNYGGAVKQYLLSKVTLLRIHRFDPADVQFDDALVSSSVVWFKKTPPPQSFEVEFTFGGSVEVPRVRRQVPALALEHEKKWTRYPVSDVREVSDGPKLKDFFKIQRGLATGDNKFFIMTAEEAKYRRLPFKFLRPILPSPRYLPENEIEADAQGNPVLPRPLFLLDCRLPESEVRTLYPALWEYLQTGVPNVSERYLCAHRSPWYSQEERQPTPFVCTYMGRSDGNSSAPFRFIFNRSKAIAANVYLLLYPKPPLAQALATEPELAGKIWDVLRAIRPESLLGEGRVYGGGLHKVEPKELGNVPAPELAELLAATDNVSGKSLAITEAA